MTLVYVIFGLVAAICFLFLPFMNRFKAFPTPRDRGAVLLGILFVLAGTLHFLSTEAYVAVMPDWFPESSHKPLVIISGIFEILGGLGLLLRITRRAAGWGLTALLIAVFPANIDMAINGVDAPGLPTEPLIYWIRLPFQFLFIAWALWCSNALKKDV